MANEFKIKSGIITPAITVGELKYPSVDGLENQALVTNGNGEFIFTDLPPIVTNLNDLTDVDTLTTEPVNGYGLVWNGTQWVPGKVLADVASDAAPELGGDLDATNTYKIINLIDPTNPQDAATKAYVDANVFSGSYNDLTDVPAFSAVALSGDYSDLLNAPVLADVATSGDYGDLINTPVLAPVATSGSYNDLSDAPVLADVAISGSYDDLTNTPSIPAVIDDLADVDTTTISPTTGQALVWNGSQWAPSSVALDALTSVVEDTAPQLGGSLDAQSLYKVFNLVDPTDPQDAATKAYVDANVFSGSYNDLTDVPDFADVALSGDYGDLINAPVLAPVATSGSYNDLTDTPVLSAVALSGDYSDLLNAPVLADVATSGSYNDLADTPSIPASINDLSDVDTSTVAPTSGQALVWDGSQWAPETINVGITVVEDDTAPKLGGDLDVNGNAIVSSTDGDINITPDGAGVTNIGGYVLEKKKTAAVAANATSVFETYDVSFTATYIDYIFATSSGTRVGTLIVATDGTVVSVADPGTDVGTVDITFNGSISNGSVEISYTENNGDSGNLTWTSRRMAV